jgi:hypothetical protein
MAGLNTSLNYGAVGAEASRLAQSQQLRVQEEAVASQLRTSFGTAMPEPGSVITAKYQYKVAADGSLYPTQTRITTEAAEPESLRDKRLGEKRRNPNREADGRQATLANISRPRPELSPADELALFAMGAQSRLSSIGASSDNALAAVTAALVQGEGEDAAGNPIETEILPPQTRGEGAENVAAPLINLSARAQQAVSSLYANNSNAVYNVNAQAFIAA